MRALLALPLLLALGLSGCSSDDSTGDGGDPTTPAPTTTGGMMDHTAKTHDVTIQGSQFVNGTLTIYMGDTVRWTHNDGNTPHTVSSASGSAESFDSHPNCAAGVPVGAVCMVQGSPAFEHRFENAGEFGYRCKVHSSMTGTVTVLEHTM
jgi:plastocyanin